MKNYQLLRAIVIAKMIVKHIDKIIVCFLLFALYIGLISMIPPIKGGIGLKILIILPVLLAGVYFRCKFNLARTSNTIKPSNLVYCILYYAIFILLISYVPENIKIFPEHLLNTIIIAVGIALFLVLGDHLFRKIRITYWKYKNLIEKGKKYDELAPLINDLAKKIRH